MPQEARTAVASLCSKKPLSIDTSVAGVEEVAYDTSRVCESPSEWQHAVRMLAERFHPETSDLKFTSGDASSSSVLRKQTADSIDYSTHGPTIVCSLGGEYGSAIGMAPSLRAQCRLSSCYLIAAAPVAMSLGLPFVPLLSSAASTGGAGGAHGPWMHATAGEAEHHIDNLQSQAEYAHEVAKGTFSATTCHRTAAASLMEAEMKSSKAVSVIGRLGSLVPGDRALIVRIFAVPYVVLHQLGLNLLYVCRSRQ